MLLAFFGMPGPTHSVGTDPEPLPLREPDTVRLQGTDHCEHLI